MTGYDTEPVSGLAFAGARFYQPELGMFLTHDPARQFASPYAYGPWDPINGTDPTGMFWEWVLLIAAIATAAAVGIDVGVRTGDPTAGFKAAMLTVANSFIPPLVNLGLGLVSGDTKTLVFQVVPFAGSVYAIVSAAENGMYATAVVGALLLAVAAYSLLAGGEQSGEPKADVDSKKG